MTSARGRSHTFDERADGYARGEACGGVALRGGMDDGAGLGLFGSAVRQDGRSASLTAPNGQAQQGLLTTALSDASTPADALVLNEAHGTGTALGDPIEAGSLTGVYLARRASTSVPFGIGSLKAIAGHTEPGAGLAGTLKLLVQLIDATLSPNAQLRLINQRVASALDIPSDLPVQLSRMADTPRRSPDGRRPRRRFLAVGI